MKTLREYIDELSAIEEGIFDRFKKKDPAQSLPKPRAMPNEDNIDQWMADMVEYYKQTRPKDLWVLFCPSSGDYLPATIHAATSEAAMRQHVKPYLALKRQNPDAAAEALRRANEANIYKNGPLEDYPSHLR